MVACASAWKSRSDPTAARASLRALVFAGPWALKYRSRADRTRSLEAWTPATGALAAKAADARTRAAAIEATRLRTGDDLLRIDARRGGHLQRRGGNLQPARGLLHGCPGDLRVEEGLEALAVRP